MTPLLHENQSAGIEMDEHLIQYRAYLVQAAQKAQDDFDRALLSLSGGALGISFAFIKDVVGQGPFESPGYLFFAWLCWGISIIFALTSYFVSGLAFRRSIDQVDRQTIRPEHPGGLFDTITGACNILGGVLFFVGVMLIAYFVWHNFVDIK
jgi:hypothetical protein